MRTVALETATQPGSLALLDGNQVVYDAGLATGRRTTETFAEQMRDAFRQVGWRSADVELFAVCEGPGSFTGLRIGVTAAKTFAYATGCRLAAVNTLAVLASQVIADAETVWAVLDAQRRQLFAAAYRRGANAYVECVAPTQIVDAQTWLPSLPAGVAVIGDGLRAWRSHVPSHVRTVAETQWTVSASALGRMGLRRCHDSQTVDLWQLVPQYYRQSAAEEKRRTV